MFSYTNTTKECITIKKTILLSQIYINRESCDYFTIHFVFICDPGGTQVHCLNCMKLKNIGYKH